MASRTGVTVVICADAKPVWFDPHNQVAGAARVLAENIVPGLLSIGDDVAPAAGLVEAWSWETTTLARLEIKSGIHFTSGQPVDAAAVCANLAYVAQSKSKRVFNAAEFSCIRRVTAINDHQIAIELERPFAPLFGMLANGFGIVDPKLGLEPSNLTGGGAFEVIRSSPRSLRLRRRRDERVPLEVEWRFCTTRAARTRRIRNRRADIILGSAGSTAARDDGWQAVRTPATGPLHVAFNMRRWPTSMEGFRFAVAEALDPGEVVLAGFKGEARPATSPYSEDSFYPIRARAVVTCKQPKPRPNGSELILAIGGESFLSVARVVARAIYRELGFDVRIVSVLNTEWWPSYYLKREWDLAIQAWTPMPDPHLVYGRRYTTDGIHNGPGYSNERLDRLIRAASETIDKRTRMMLFQEAEELRNRDMPTLYLAFPHRVAWVRQGVMGLVLRPTWSVELSEIAVRPR